MEQHAAAAASTASEMLRPVEEREPHAQASDSADDSGDDAVQQQACAADDELDEKNEIEEAVSRHLLTTTPSRESALRAAVMRVRAALGRG